MQAGRRARERSRAERTGPAGERPVLGAAAVSTDMTVMAHIGGIPVEETVASFAPVVAVAGGCCVATVRARLRRLRGPRDDRA